MTAARSFCPPEAMISGAYSMARACMQLGILPRLVVRHTSISEEGQIYMPQINAMLGRLAIESRFAGGLRITTPETMDVVAMVLVGQVQRELVGLICELFDGPIREPIVLNEAPNEIPHQYLSAEKARRELGWAPRHSFGEGGLPGTVDWYRDNQGWWEPIKSGEFRAYYEAQYGSRLAAG